MIDLTVAGQDEWFGYFLGFFLEKLEFSLLVADLDLHLCGVESRDLALLDGDPPLLPVAVRQAGADTKCCLNERQILPEDRWAGAHQQAKGHAGRHGCALGKFEKTCETCCVVRPGSCGLAARPPRTDRGKEDCCLYARQGESAGK